MGFVSTIKSKLYSFALKVYWYLKEHLRWRSHQGDAHCSRVFYGFDLLPLTHEKASGGIIKCQDLHEHFPNNFINSNILYLVSSALPPCPKYLIHNAKNKGVKLVWNQNGVAYPAWHGPGWEKTNRPLKDALHQSDYVIYQSEFCKHASERYLGVYQGPSIILYNPVDTSHFMPAATTSDGLKILMAGTHNEWYRIRVAIESFEKLLLRVPDAQLIIAGPLRWCKNNIKAIEDVNSLLRELSIKASVHLLGAYSQQDARGLFQSAHILLHTQYNDACPRLVVEAMSCGLPVVYSATGGTPELVGTKAGIGIYGPMNWDRIHEPDPVALSEALFNVYQSYNEYSHNARMRAVEFFDVSPWIEAHARIFDTLLN